MMRARISVALVIPALAFTVLAAETPSPSTPGPSSQTIQAIRMHPLAFEPNLGQAPSEASFMARTEAGAVLVQGSSLVWISASEPGGEAAPLRLVFEGSNPRAKAEGLESQKGVSNYFLGNDASQWRKGVPHYSRVKTSGLYRGVDLLLYGNGEHLEFDLVFSPGTRPEAVSLMLEGADALHLSPEGDLEIRASGREILLRRPVVYQEGRSGRHSVEATYALLSSRRVGLKLGEYDRHRALVVDPVLVFSTYHGGEYQDFASAVACDPSGNIYVAGYTSSNQFPTTAGAFQTTHRNFRTDGFVSKFDPTGTTLLYSTYLGGTSTSGATVVYGLAVDGAGNAFLTGNTNCDSFPLVNAYQQTFKSGSQAFVSKLNPAGSALVYSTYLGGTGSSNYGQAIAVDTGGNTYVAGYTNSTDFPTEGPLQAAYAGGNTDGFLTKFSPAGNMLVYSTYLGGSANDKALSVAVDGLGRVFLAGSTLSTDFPTMNPTQAAQGGYGDAFAAEVNPEGSTLLFSTYLGGGSDDGGSRIALGPTGDILVAGYTYSDNFPTLNPLQPTYAGVYSDAFLTRFSGGQVVFSTYLGGSAIEGVYGLAVDHSGNAYVSGNTGSVNFPTVSPLQADIGSPPAYHSTDGGATFPSSSSGLVATDLKAFLADPTSPGRVFAAGGYDGVYKSADLGATWTKCIDLPSSNSAYATCLAFVPGSPARILAGIYFRGLYQSTDGGSTWVFVPGTGTKSGLEVLVSDPVNPNRIFMGTNGQGFHVSTDGGMTWSPVAGYAADATVSAITFAPSDP